MSSVTELLSTTNQTASSESPFRIFIFKFLCSVHSVFLTGEAVSDKLYSVLL